MTAPFDLIFDDNGGVTASRAGHPVDHDEIAALAKMNTERARLRRRAFDSDGAA